MNLEIWIYKCIYLFSDECATNKISVGWVGVFIRVGDSWVGWSVETGEIDELRSVVICLEWRVEGGGVS